MNSSGNVNWFPGHMVKSIRKLEQISKFLDFWIELVDARAPLSSQGENLERIINSRPRILVLNKADLSDSKITDGWISYFKELNIPAMKSYKDSCPKACIFRLVNRLGIKGKFGKIRCAVVGVPNVGKSCFINRILGSKKLKIENRAGVTRDLNWVSCNHMEICDTPGILPPKMEPEFAKKLSYLGLIKSEVLNTEEIALSLIADLGYKNPKEDVLYDFAVSNGCIHKGGEADIVRASVLFLKSFRMGKLGKISLEVPNKQALSV